MTLERTLVVQLDIDGVTPTTAELADLSELRDALRGLEGVRTRTGVNHTRVWPGGVYNAADISEMLVTISGTVVTPGALTAVVLQWMKGRAQRGVRIRLGDNEIELTGSVDTEARERLLDLFESAIGDTDTQKDSGDGD